MANHPNMKKPFCLVTLLWSAPVLLAADAPPVAASWRAQTLLSAIGNVLVFAAIGIAAAIIGFKVFDKCTPGHLGREIVEHQNVAAAIVAGAVILGVSIIIAASILG
jgi:uncharacterized membrane protein YjfL (UPF0719 family)